MEKKHYEILIEGDGFSDYSQRTIDVHCTDEELEIIARAMISYVYNVLNVRCVCVAKENGGVTKSDFDKMFADCM